MSYSHPRFIISEDNTYKLLDLFRNTILIKNTRENGKIIIDLSSITEIKPIENTQDEISMTYIANGQKKTQIFKCPDRLILLNKILTMKDRSSKIISDYSIETFKCYQMINMDEKKKKILKKIGKLLSEGAKEDVKNLGVNSPNINDYKVYCTLYRTYISSIQLLNKELKNYYIDLSQIIKIKIADDVSALILENINKIDIILVPVNKNDSLFIKDLIISYAKKYLCYEIKYQENDDYLREVVSSPNIKFVNNQIREHENKMLEKRISALKAKNNLILPIELKVTKEKSDSTNISKGKSNQIKKMSSLFGNEALQKEIKAKIREQDKKDYLFIHYNVNRIVYNKDKLNLVLKSNAECINLFSINGEKIAQIKISDIFAVIVNGEEENYFEIILDDKCSRFIFEVEKKNNILSDIIELLLKYRKDENYLILSYKISFSRKHNYMQQESRKTCEDYLIEQIKNDFFHKDNIMIILEEIILNFFLGENSSRKIQDLLVDNSLVQNLLEKLDFYYNDIINLIDDKSKDDYKKQYNIQNDVIMLNLLFIFFKNLGLHLLLEQNGKIICDKIFEILSKEIKSRYYKDNEYSIILNDYALFYNAIHILENFSLFKQMLLVKVFSLGREYRLINLEQEIDIESMFINTLLIIIENKLKEIKELDILISDSSYYFLLFILYKIFVNESTCVLRNGTSLLYSILERLGEKKQRFVKEVMLKKTLILFALIKIFISNNNNDAMIAKNCLKLFQILIPQYYEMSIPIKNLFPNTLIQIFGNQKDPDKWDKAQCDKFFISILKDYNEEKVIWNQECKKELINALSNLIDEYEKSIYKKINANQDINMNHNNLLDEGLFNDLIDIIFNVENYSNFFPDDFFKKKYVDSKPFFNIDYKNYKVTYKTLKREVYILDIYINQLLKDNKKEINIQRPKKFWKKLKKELISNNDEKRISILKVMILVYNKYYSIIGEFDYYNIANKIYKSTNNDKVHSYIIKLINDSISIDDEEIKQNNLLELNKEDIFLKLNIINSRKLNK